MNLPKNIEQIRISGIALQSETRTLVERLDRYLTHARLASAVLIFPYTNHESALILKAEEIEELKHQNQLLTERNQQLINQNYLLAEQIDQKWNQIEFKLLDFHIMIQQLNLAKYFILHLLWKLQSSLLKQKYLTEPFLNLDIERSISTQKEIQKIIQNLKNQRTKN